MKYIPYHYGVLCVCLLIIADISYIARYINPHEF